MIRNEKRNLDYVFRLFNCFHREVSVFFYYLKENVFHCITSILLLEQKQAIKYVSTYKDIKDLLSARRKIWWEKPKKKQKWQDSPRQVLNPDHGPQHGAVKCSTHWAAGNLSTFEAEFQTHMLGVLRTAKIKPTSIGVITEDDKNVLFNGLQLTRLVRRNSLHQDFLSL